MPGLVGQDQPGLGPAAAGQAVLQELEGQLPEARAMRLPVSRAELPEEAQEAVRGTAVERQAGPSLVVTV